MIGWKEKRRFNAVFPSNGVWNGIKRYDSKTIRKRYENAVLDKKIGVANVPLQLHVHKRYTIDRKRQFTVISDGIVIRPLGRGKNWSYD